MFEIIKSLGLFDTRIRGLRDVTERFLSMPRFMIGASASVACLLSCSLSVLSFAALVCSLVCSLVRSLVCSLVCCACLLLSFRACLACIRALAYTIAY